LGFFCAAAAINPQGQVNTAEYTFGLHAQTTYQAEAAKSQIWGSVNTPPVVVTPAPLRSIWASQEALDLSINGWSVEGAQALQGPVPPTIFASQDDPRQIPAQVWKAQVAVATVPNPAASFFSIPPQTEDRPTSVIWRSLRAGQTPPVIASFYAAPQQADLTQQAVFAQPGLPVGRVPAPTQGAPQLADLTQQGQLSAPTPASQGQVPPLTKGTPQPDPTQVAPLVSPSQGAPAVVPNPIAPSFVVPPQTEDRPTRAIFASQTMGATTAVIPSLRAAPQPADLTQQALFVSPSSPPLSPAFNSLYATPQQVDLTQQGWILGAAPVKQGPVPPLTFVPVTDLSQTLGYQIPAKIFVSAATPPAAPPNLHKLYLDVTTGRLYWQVSQTSNPTLIIPL
jgi:hypothetical protein